MKIDKLTQAGINAEIASLRNDIESRDYATDIALAFELVAEMLKTRDVILHIADYVNEKIRSCKLEDDEKFDCGDICVSICAAYIYYKGGREIEYSPRDWGYPTFEVEGN